MDRKICLMMLFINALLFAWTITYSQIDLEGIHNLTEELQMLNLFNGLELEKDQVNVILKNGFYLEEQKGRLVEENDVVLTEYGQVLEEIKGDLLQSKSPEKDLQRKYHALESSVNGFLFQFQEEQKAVTLHVMDVLNGFQLYTIENFRPCVIPPEGPVRAGQAESAEGIEMLLTSIRQMPKEMFVLKRDEIVDRMVDKRFMHLPLGFQLTREEEVNRLSELFDRIRSLSDLDFSLNLESLADEVKNDDMFPKPPVDSWVKVYKYLLSPEALTLLQEMQR